MGTSHLIMGELADYLTGETLPDTHDERILQKIERFLVEEKGYAKTDIRSRQPMRVNVDGQTGTLSVHFIIQVHTIAFAVIMYGPGSIVTRQRPTLSVARLFEKHVIPYALITNGTDANLLDVITGKVMGKDLNSLPSKTTAIGKIQTIALEKLSPERRAKEERILYAMDILTHAECRDFVCTLP